MTIDEMSNEDKKIFLEAMKGVKPLKNTTALSSKTSEEVKEIAQYQSVKPHAALNRPADINAKRLDAYLSNYYKTEVSPETALSYRQSDITNTQWRLLKSGQIPWQARLDLHRLNTDSARESIVEFIGQQLSINIRCVLIIHGKGSLRGEPPVLKNLVNHWLQQIPQVLAFHSAIPKHGGNGALYVLLKKNEANRAHE